MYGHIEGELIYKRDQKIIIKTNTGIGFEINAFVDQNLGQKCALFTSFIVSENVNALYGFSSARDKDIFEVLKSVNKVGPSTAFNLLSQIGSDVLISAVFNEDEAMISKAKGIGKSIAQRIILDLKTKLEKKHHLFLSKESNLEDPFNLDESKSDSKNSSYEMNSSYQEALLALEGLGYKSFEVVPLLQKQLKESKSNDASTLVQSVLKGIRS